MKITEIEVGEIFVPLAKPFKTALRTVENVEDIVVRITTCLLYTSDAADE